MSSFTRAHSSTLSLREKSLVKRRINKEHNSNFKAGYVHINEEQLHKTGIRGRKRYFLYCIVCILVLMVIINMLITVTLFTVLKINKDGMQSLEFIPKSLLLRFLKDSDMNEVDLVMNSIGSLPDEHLEISGMDDQNANLKITQINGSSVTVNSQKVKLVSQDDILFIDPDSGEVIFSTDFANDFKFPRESKSLKVDYAYTSRLTSDIDEDLKIEGSDTVTLRGSEGLDIKTKEIWMNARRDVDINAEGDIILEAEENMFVDQVRKFPAATGSNLDPNIETFKVCVCNPSGKLFTVPATYRCDQANEQTNPCDN